MASKPAVKPGAWMLCRALIYNLHAVLCANGDRGATDQASAVASAVSVGAEGGMLRCAAGFGWPFRMSRACVTMQVLR